MICKFLHTRRRTVQQAHALVRKPARCSHVLVVEPVYSASMWKRGVMLSLVKPSKTCVMNIYLTLCSRLVCIILISKSCPTGAFYNVCHDSTFASQHFTTCALSNGTSMSFFFSLHHMFCFMQSITNWHPFLLNFTLNVSRPRINWWKRSSELAAPIGVAWVEWILVQQWWAYPAEE